MPFYFQRCVHQNAASAQQKGTAIIMNYQQLMTFLSDCGLGAVLIASDTEILDANPAADRLLHGNGALTGLRLVSIAQALCDASAPPAYSNIAFSQYLERCNAAVLPDLPAGAKLVVFRDATPNAAADMLRNVIDQIDEAVVLCDAEGRICLLNDAAVKLDSIVNQDVQGKLVTDVYSMLDGSEMAIPRVIRDRKPLLDQRQYYSTCYGRRIDIVSNNYPIIQNGQILGAFNLMRDLSTIQELHQEIIHLQAKLLEKENAAPVRHEKKSALSAQYSFSDIIRRSPSMHGAVTQCMRAAKTDASVMLCGETGTGKEMFAQSIHTASRRANGPFLAINCAAIPENLLESLLFGTEKGAYTGAERRPGLFEQANGGTLLLDEINSMNMNLQAKLLRVLQDGVIRRVGGSTQTQVDVRVLSIINMPPLQAIAEHRLRHDIFYRLGVVNVTVPPLRERREDIPLLAKRFIMQNNQKLGRNVHDIDKDTLEHFYLYAWPGNVRELQHAIEHAMILLPDTASTITPEYLPAYICADRTPDEPVPDRPGRGSLKHAVKNYERQIICQTLRECGGNITEAAQTLGLSRQNMQYYIKLHGVDLSALSGAVRPD